VKRQGWYSQGVSPRGQGIRVVRREERPEGVHCGGGGSNGLMSLGFI